jgi:polysaccharide export outer membrane protein
MNSRIDISKSRGFLARSWSAHTTGVLMGIAGIYLAGAHGLVSAQDTAQTPAANAIKSAASGSTEQGMNSSATYRLMPTDLIAVSVFEEPDLAAQPRIAEDGTIALPLIGSVKISGSTVKQAIDTITALYKQDYLVHPVVTVAVLEQTKGKLTILGAVGRAGMVEMPAVGGIPIMEAIAMAGGFTRVASQSRITVKRSTQGVEHVFKINGKGQATGEEKTFLVYPGDVINVGESIF